MYIDPAAGRKAKSSNQVPAVNAACYLHVRRLLDAANLHFFFYVHNRTISGEDKLVVKASTRDLWDSLGALYPFCQRESFVLVANSTKLEKDLLALEERKVREVRPYVLFYVVSKQNTQHTYTLFPSQRLNQFKVGVLYYSEGQTDENAIFGNSEYITTE